MRALAAHRDRGPPTCGAAAIVRAHELQEAVVVVEVADRGPAQHHRHGVVPAQIAEAGVHRPRSAPTGPVGIAGEDVMEVCAPLVIVAHGWPARGVVKDEGELPARAPYIDCADTPIGLGQGRAQEDGQRYDWYQRPTQTSSFHQCAPLTANGPNGHTPSHSLHHMSPLQALPDPTDCRQIDGKSRDELHNSRSRLGSSGSLQVMRRHTLICPHGCPQ